MSALPKGINSPNSVHPFIAKAVEETDNSILSDKEVYELKGGDKVFLIKLAAGLGAAGAYIFLFNRVGQICSFNIRGKSNNLLYFQAQLSSGLTSTQF